MIEINSCAYGSAVLLSFWLVRLRRACPESFLSADDKGETTTGKIPNKSE